MAGTCALCLRSMSTTATGLLRIHGPLIARCPGSGKPPRPLASSRISPSMPTSASSPVLAPAVPSPASTPSPVLPTIPRNRVLKRIPKAARHQCSARLATVLGDVVRHNSVEAWSRLFLFAPRCLRLPQRGKHPESLSSLVRQQLRDDLALSVQ